MRHPVYRCTGHSSWGGPCGAYDCITCYPDRNQEPEMDDEPEDDDDQIEIPDKVIRW